MSAGTKRIFISDIHMGDQRSMGQPPSRSHPYGWLQKNIPTLTKFLRDKLQAEDVGDVIVLGDLFDQWVIPSNQDPLATVTDICSNPANKGIIDNLKELARSSKLSYVPGNHDMSACQEDLPILKSFINATFPGIHFICDDDQPAGVYRKDNLVAEHGNMHCLFNAPDRWSAPGSFLPLGYFISRMVAYKVAETGQPENVLDILFKFILEFSGKPNFIYDLFLAVADDARLKKTDKIRMGNMNGFGETITIDEVASQYVELIRNWDEHHVKISSPIAITDDCGELLEAAFKLYLGPGTSPDIDIAIFGHTHAWRNEDPYPLLDENVREGGPSLSPSACKAIYANSGTWVDSTHHCTYVETEVDEENQLHYVRVKSYPGDILLQERFVAL